jgi:hypothetical protein
VRRRSGHASSKTQPAKPCFLTPARLTGKPAGNVQEETPFNWRSVGLQVPGPPQGVARVMSQGKKPPQPNPSRTRATQEQKAKKVHIKPCRILNIDSPFPIALPQSGRCTLPQTPLYPSTQSGRCTLLQIPLYPSTQSGRCTLLQTHAVYASRIWHWRKQSWCVLEDGSGNLPHTIGKNPLEWTSN